MTHVVILVPGIMGSVLKLGDQVIWPGPLLSLVRSFDKMTELMSDDLVATDCIRNYSITTQYDELIHGLAACGFSEQNGTLVVAAYDWRKDNAKSADILARHIEATAKRFSGHPSLAITIIAHSMGGLIARHYLESNSFRGRGGFSSVRELITLATPHLGAAVALPLVLGQERRLFLNAQQVKTLCSDPRFPAAYQLLPPKTEPFVWDRSSGMQLVPVEIYQQNVATSLGLVPENLAAADRFHASLDLTKRPANVRYFCFGGTTQSTVTHAALDRGGVRGVEMNSGGDGTVPIWSSFLCQVQRSFCGGEHGTIYKNRELLRYLAALLGKDGLLGAGPEIDLAIRDKVVEPQSIVHLAITFSRPTGSFSAALLVKSITVDDVTGTATLTAVPGPPQPISYNGPDLEGIATTLNAPRFSDMYRLVLQGTAGQELAHDDFIVQSPP